ncbi:syntaxin-19 isoform X2 [Oncorhynchus tshawytscha]|uniref:t-SNARE coiled-coil homology domain-containing protein n=1 Tax=Oncorhynchus tshawytscha TaxID=74940 RepID=A0A8C8DC86_ONCTS|nr:syntaxin-19 isoform X1 [Oncorhynchus tshawytscha]XP_024264248.1 syntaxin-19 isoform X1 [Oncorhynchus tshawytscha]XP_042175689.1 syntaxin-19 isoform X2 [Oncorhynchus tshawytscha]
MKDRLEELRQRAQGFREVSRETDDTPFPEEDANPDAPLGVKVATPQQAVVFEQEPVLHNFLSEAQHIRGDITELETEVKKFSQQQRTLVATMRRFSVMKKDSDVTTDIKLQAESIHRRLDDLSKKAQSLEDMQGLATATTRIQRSQHAVLHRQFQQVMCLYNNSILSKQEHCKNFLIRQLEVFGRDVTEEGVDEMVATGKWEVFNQNLLNDERITRAQLSEIEQRHKELLNLESNMKELRELFMDIFMLVEEQGGYIDNIQTSVEKTQDYVTVTNEKFKMATRYKKKNPLRRLCCCCCPWRCCT